jgi:hypothetical protein
MSAGSRKLISSDFRAGGMMAEGGIHEFERLKEE